MRWTRTCSAACPAVVAKWRRCWKASMRRTRAGFASLKINCVVQRGINEDQVMPLLERFRGSGHVLRFIEYMDVGNCNGWKRERSGHLRPNCATASPPDGRCARWIPTIAAKWPRATASRTARARSASSVRSARPSAATAIARAFPPMAGFTPACSRARARTCAARWRVAKRPWSNRSPGSGRGARIATANCAANARRRSGRHVEMFLIGG